MFKNKILNRAKAGNFTLLIADVRSSKTNPDIGFEFQILDADCRCVYSFLGDYEKCFDKYIDRLSDLGLDEDIMIYVSQQPKPDLSEYHGERIECGGFVQGKLSLGV